MSFLAKFTQRSFIVLNVLAAIAFLITCLNWYINPGEWWFVALMGLPFPFMVLAHVIFVIGWAIVRSKWAFLSILVLILGYSNIRVLFGTNFTSDFKTEKPDSTIRLLSWNVHQFGFWDGPKNGLLVRRQILDYIKKQDADILCMQEFISDNPGMTKHISIFELLRDMGYPYYFYSEDYSLWRGRYTSGVAIFSRFPITDSFRIRYPGEAAKMTAESLVAADILVNRKPIRVFTTHLQSNMIAREEYGQLSSARGVRDSLFTSGKSIVKKLKRAYEFRSQQADKVAAALDASPHPEVISGDFNDIPNSYTYFRLSQNRQDAFVEKGWALSRTFSHISPTLRIDYIFADKQYEILQYKRDVLPYSDHYPIIADLRLHN
ncbi:MAG: endonuclease/exonuclease/phosphatase family protein [Flavitalea sp.]